MRTWTIGKKLLSGVGAMFALALLMGGAGLLAARSLNNELVQVGRHDAAASGEAAHIQYLIANLSVLARQTVIAAARNQGAEVTAKISESNAQLAELRSARQQLDQLTGDADVARLSRAIDGAMAQWEGKAQEAQKFAQAFSTVEAIEAIDASKSFSDSADKAAREIVEVLHKRMDANIQAASTGYAVTFGVLILMGIAVVVVGALVLYSVRTTVASLVAVAARLRRRSDHVQAASATVSASSQSLSRGATTQAASLEETSASIEEMSSMTQQNAQNSRDAAALMQRVDQTVADSNAALNDMLAGMSGIRESSERVGKIIKTIDEIAFQTNILALNAAVEAARAGAAGMGFAVVAEEVRNLAQRSGAAARDTAALIEESLVKARDGSAKAEVVATAIGAITTSVTQAAGLVAEVSEASRQQADGIRQVSQTVTAMEQNTQTTAATAEESAATSEELQTEANKMMEMVSQLESMVGVAADSEEGAPTAPAAASPRTATAPAAQPARATARRAARPTLVHAAARPQPPAAADGTFGAF